MKKFELFVPYEAERDEIIINGIESYMLEELSGYIGIYVCNYTYRLNDSFVWARVQSLDSDNIVIKTIIIHIDKSYIEKNYKRKFVFEK